MPWTLEGELYKIFQTEDIASAFDHIGITKLDYAGVETLSDWHRGGSETYIMTVRVNRIGRLPFNAILKACTPTSMSAISVEATLNDWLAKRKLLDAAGVPTPKLLGVGSGIIFEEYIEFTFPEALSQSSARSHSSLCIAAAEVTGTILKLGFRPTTLLRDLRSRGADAVVVDFGQDLGIPVPPKPIPRSLKSEWIELSGVRPTGDSSLARRVIQAYRDARR